MALGRGIEAGKAFVKFVLSDKEFGQKLEKIGSKLQKIGAIGLAISGPIVAGFAASISAASDLEETMNKFNVVFGDQADVVKAWGDEFAGQIGRSKKQVADFLAGSQDLFVPLGFEPGAATDLSKQVTGLAIDLASFNNMADGDALRDLHAALTGSGEVMKKYGVIVSEAAVKQELLNQRIDPKTATNQQKVQARLNIIMAGTTAAQGDAIRSAGSYANQMKTLSGAMMDLSAAIGTAVLPAVTALVTWAVTIARATAAWVEDNQTLVMILGIVAAVVAVVSGGLVALGTLLTLYSVVAAGATGATAAFGVVLAIISAHPIIAALTAIAALVLGVAAYFGLASDAAGDFNSSLDSVDVPGASTSSAAAAQSSRVQADLQAALGGAPARPVAAAAVATKPTPSRDYGAEIAKATRETADGIAHLLRIAKYNPLTAPSSLIASFLP